MPQSLQSKTKQTYKFSKRSLKKLEWPVPVHPDLVNVIHKALEYGEMDFSILDGGRTQEQQNRLYAQGRTEPGDIVTWTLNSNHLAKPDGFAHAVDIAPYPIDWDDEFRFTLLAEIIKDAAIEEGVDLDWGYDLWGRDMPHFQLGASYSSGD